MILSIHNAVGAASMVTQQDESQHLEDTASDDPNSTDYVEDEVGSLFLLVILAVVMMICFGIGFAITLVAILIVSGLIIIGLLSVSAIVSFYQKSVAAGFKTMLYLSAVIGGTILGGVTAFLFNKIVHWSSSQLVLIIGSVGGLLAGLLFAYFIQLILKKTYAIYQQKREEKSIETM